MGTMKMKNFFCLLSLYGFLSMNTIAAVFNILVVNTEIVLSVNDRPFIKPQGAGQEPRSIPMDVPFSAFLNDDYSIDLEFYQSIGEIEIVISQNGDVVYSSTENIDSPILRKVQLQKGLVGDFLLEIKGLDGAYAFGRSVSYTHLTLPTKA